MKKFYTIIFIATISFSLFGQGPADDPNLTDYYEDLGDFDAKTSVDLGNPIYDMFFSNLCSLLKSAKTRTTFVDYDQCNTSGSYNGKTTEYGVGCKTCGPKSKRRQCYICDIGCAETCLSMILRNSGYYNEVTPSSLQDWMAIPSNYGFDGCSVKWGAINKYPDIANGKVTLVGHIAPNESLTAARDIIKAGGFATIKVNANLVNSDGTITKFEHHMLLYDYVGDGTSADEEDFVVSDPASYKENGKRKVLSDFFTGSWPSAKFYYTGTVTTGEYKSKLYSVANKTLQLSTNTVSNTPSKKFGFGDYIKLAFKLILRGSGLKSEQENYCNILWTITDPNGYTSTKPDQEFTTDALYTPGTYIISCVVSDDSGIYSDVQTITVDSPNNTPPVDYGVVDFTWTPANPTTVDGVTFKTLNYIGDGTWDFGEGSGSHLIEVTHIMYSTPGIYNVKLTLADGTVISHYISIATYVPPPPIPPAPPTPPTPPSHIPYLTPATFTYAGSCGTASPLDKVFTIQTSTNGAFKIQWGDGVNESWVDPVDAEQFPGFKLMTCKYLLQHLYNNEGSYQLDFSDAIYNNHIAGKANIVDCNKTRTSIDINNAVNYSLGWGQGYFAGYFVLNDLNNIANYNSQKLFFLACNSIKLQSGFHVKPTTGNYILFSAGKITGSRKCEVKSAKISDLNAPNYGKNKTTNIAKGIIIYPNPTDGTITIANLSTNDRIIQVYNSYGQLLYSVNNYNNQQDIDLSKYSSGVYLLKVFEGNTAKIFKVMKQ